MLKNLIIWGIVGIVCEKLLEVLYEKFVKDEGIENIIIDALLLLIVGFIGAIPSIFVPLDLDTGLALLAGILLERYVISRLFK